VGQSSPKSRKTCYPLRPPSCQISSRLVKPAWRIALPKFCYTLQYFGSPRVTSLGRGVHQPPPSSNLENFVLFWRPFSEIPAAKVSRFCCRRDGLLNSWSKVWPWILIWAYLILNFAPIFGQQISILDPPYIGLFGQSWSERSPYGWIAGGGVVGWAGDIFLSRTDRNVTT